MSNRAKFQSTREAAQQIVDDLDWLPGQHAKFDAYLSSHLPVVHVTRRGHQVDIRFPHGMVLQITKGREDAILKFDGAPDDTGVVIRRGVIRAPMNRRTVADGCGAAPPALAEMLVALLTRDALGEAILGDMAETFARDLLSHGVRRANRLYWARAIRSVTPLILSAIKRAASITALAAAIAKLLRS